MREINFRAWNASERKMTTPFIWVNESNLLSTCMCSAPTHELMQFTGMHDKNGVPIYEGDVLIEENNCYWLVSFLYGRFIAHVPDTIYNFVDLDDYLFCVVGNIHQHAHLLEQNKC